MAHGTKLNGSLRSFIERQKVFFVATAAETGTVNLSPKGADSLRILDDTRIMWLNLTGSGNETAGHVQRQNRMTLMFCAFEGDALILRLYGTVNTLHPRDAQWDAAAEAFPEMAGSRQIFEFKIDRLQTSCGTGVPLMPFQEDRVDDELLPYYADMGPEGVDAYWRKKNTTTIDGFDTGLFED
ncbi:pyridoxamine 5'-phosphate oxidase family protein [uncultured Litoreibacter sp.]|uniref:pyridoxamine 5'-phosphate oxidase family protein n=1 Tax=uncultured Litoreibacter sp. TaxID=1392394 RepID=UPI002638BDCF|nr:pyridoxamine 5'-phosphate oxidase family protein [uncultured Litoreibacter sp.]